MKADTRRANSSPATERRLWLHCPLLGGPTTLGVGDQVSAANDGCAAAMSPQETRDDSTEARLLMPLRTATAERVTEQERDLIQFVAREVTKTAPTKPLTLEGPVKK